MKLVITRTPVEDVVCIDDEENADWLKGTNDRIEAIVERERRKPVSFSEALPDSQGR